jgi:hypothetical protein
MVTKVMLSRCAYEKQTTKMQVFEPEIDYGKSFSNVCRLQLQPTTVSSVYRRFRRWRFRR